MMAAAQSVGSAARRRRELIGAAPAQMDHALPRAIAASVTDLERFMSGKTYALVPIYGLDDEVRYLIAERDPVRQRDMILPRTFHSFMEAEAAKAALEEQEAGVSPGAPTTHCAEEWSASRR